MSPVVDVVIARYNEDISWTQKLHYNVFIYNKGSELPNSIKLPNVGRESHTYIEHVLRHYDTMDPNGITVFSQGSISDTLMYYKIYGKPEHVHIIELSEEAREKDFSESKAYWHDLIYAHQPLENFRISEWPAGVQLTPNKNNETFGQWFRRCLEMDHLPDKSQFKWVVGANFAVKNKKILSRSKEFYLNLLQEINDSNAPESGHFFERSWYYIFNAHIK